MFVLGLTGSIGMGKSTVGEMFEQEGVQVINADKIVYQLYAKSGKAVEQIQKLFPNAVVQGAVDRQELGKYVVGDEEAMKQLEAIVHPLVQLERQQLIQTAKDNGEKLIVMDIPLLYETQSEKEMDGVLVVSASLDVQKQRVLQRPSMTMEKFEYILSRQVPDEEKRQKADFVIDTSVSLEETRNHVKALIQGLIGRQGYS